jgi:hypothetical protein
MAIPEFWPRWSPAQNVPQSIIIKMLATTAGKIVTNRKKAPRLQINRNAKRINK